MTSTCLREWSEKSHVQVTELFYSCLKPVAPQLYFAHVHGVHIRLVRGYNGMQEREQSQLSDSLGLPKNEKKKGNEWKSERAPAPPVWTGATGCERAPFSNTWHLCR